MVDREDSMVEVEQHVHRLLRQQPFRRAPESLHERVWSELDRLASLPWWRRSFSHWPLVARVTFLLLSTAASALTLIGSAHLTGPFPALRRLSESLTWVGAAAEALRSVLRAIPSAWMGAAATTAALSYAALFALGAVAYRALYLSPRGDGSGIP